MNYDIRLNENKKESYTNYYIVSFAVMRLPIKCANIIIIK